MSRNHESQKLFTSRKCEIGFPEKGFPNKENCEVITYCELRLHTHFENTSLKGIFFIRFLTTVILKNVKSKYKTQRNSIFYGTYVESK